MQLHCALFADRAHSSGTQPALVYAYRREQTGAYTVLIAVAHKPLRITRQVVTCSWVYPWVTPNRTQKDLRVCQLRRNAFVRLRIGVPRWYG